VVALVPAADLVLINRGWMGSWVQPAPLEPSSNVVRHALMLGLEQLVRVADEDTEGGRDPPRSGGRHRLQAEHRI
jgi:hypothetical protein